MINGRILTLNWVPTVCSYRFICLFVGVRHSKLSSLLATFLQTCSTASLETFHRYKSSRLTIGILTNCARKKFRNLQSYYTEFCYFIEISTNCAHNCLLDFHLNFVTKSSIRKFQMSSLKRSALFNVIFSIQQCSVILVLNIYITYFYHKFVAEFSH